MSSRTATSQVQVALGQYDIGIASRCWIDELLVRYGRDSIVPILPLDLDSGPIAVGGQTPLASLAATGGRARGD